MQRESGLGSGGPQRNASMWRRCARSYALSYAIYASVALGIFGRHGCTADAPPLETPYPDWDRGAGPGPSCSVVQDSRSGEHVSRFQWSGDHVAVCAEPARDPGAARNKHTTSTYLHNKHARFAAAHKHAACGLWKRRASLPDSLRAMSSPTACSDVSSEISRVDVHVDRAIRVHKGLRCIEDRWLRRHRHLHRILSLRAGVRRKLPDNMLPTCFRPESGKLLRASLRLRFPSNVSRDGRVRYRYSSLHMRSRLLRIHCH